MSGVGRVSVHTMYLWQAEMGIFNVNVGSQAKLMKLISNFQFENV